MASAPAAAESWAVMSTSLVSFSAATGVMLMAFNAVKVCTTELAVVGGVGQDGIFLAAADDASSIMGA
jgi:hypothetical protein